MATLAQVEQALTNAHFAGDMNAARVLAAIAKKERAKRETDPLWGIPEVYDENTDVEGTVEKQPEPTVVDQVVGAGEAALTTATGATTGTAGFIGATLKNIANEMLSGEFGSQESARRVEEAAIKGMQDLTYIPKTEAGQDIVETLGEIAEPLVAVAPLGAEMQALGAASRVAAPVATAVTQERIIAPIAKTAAEAVEQVSQSKPTPGTGPSVGAQAVDKTTLRQTAAEELPVPIKLTKGQKTRDFEQLRFERETAKMGEEGAPIRERLTEQNLRVQQNMDAFIDATGAEIQDLRGIGEVVDAALQKRAKRDKTKIRTLYKEAEKSGEMSTPVNLQALVKTLNELESVESTAPIVTVAKKEMVRLGGAKLDESGQLVLPDRPAAKPDADFPEVGDLDNLIVETPESLILARGGELKTSGSNFFTNDADLALDYAGQKVGVYKLPPDKVPEFHDLKTLRRLTDEQRSVLDDLQSLGPDLAGNTPPWFISMLKEDGYDGFRHGPFTVVFNPDAIQPVKVWSASAPPQPGVGLTLAQTEQLRKLINKSAGNDPTNIKFAGDIKRVIDDSTDGLGGDAYKKARAARAKYSKDYEDITLIKQILNAKRGSNERAIAMEDVLRKSIFQPSTSLDSIRQLRKLLQTEGADGKQAWKELQGGTLRHIRDEALKSVATDSAGNRVVSPSQLDRVINQLDKSGKLDFIFGKKGASKLRLLNEVAQDILTAPPGVINTSNTATVLAGLVDVAISGTAGIPAPIMSSFRLATKSIKDAKLRARVKQALGEE